jgi:uncharacterized cupin superfamily protein
VDPGAASRELYVTFSGVIDFGPSQRHTAPLPTASDWEFDGASAENFTLLHRSADGAATTYLWDCVQGRLNFSCPREWTVYVAQGALVVKDECGFHYHLSTGSSALFPAGSRADWSVDRHAQLVVFCRDALPRLYRLRGWLSRLLPKILGIRLSGLGNSPLA